MFLLSQNDIDIDWLISGEIYCKGQFLAKGFCLEFALRTYIVPKESNSARAQFAVRVIFPKEFSVNGKAIRYLAVVLG